MLDSLRKKKELLLLEKASNTAYQAYIYILNRETNISGIYAGKIKINYKLEDMVLDNLKKMCFLRGEVIEIIKESESNYLITIDRRRKLIKKK